MLQTISKWADHLSRLVGDLLLASNVSEEGTQLDIQTRPLPAPELVAETVSGFADLADRIETEVSEIAVDCDRVRAVQCLGNLLSNAGKYSYSDSVIRVVMQAPEGESWVAIEVIDEGRGIPADELERVFERFYRVEDPMTMTMTMTTGGSGLGLYISWELARAMGGDLTAKSTLGEGSTFTLTLTKASLVGEPEDGGA